MVSYVCGIIRLLNSGQNRAEKKAWKNRFTGFGNRFWGHSHHSALAERGGEGGEVCL